MYTNADCLMNKRDELKSLLNCMLEKPHVIAIVEIRSKAKSHFQLSEWL